MYSVSIDLPRSNKAISSINKRISEAPVSSLFGFRYDGKARKYQADHTPLTIIDLQALVGLAFLSLISPRQMRHCVYLVDVHCI